MTGDRNKRPISTYDAVVFNMNVLHSSGIAPWAVPNFTRSENQRFVFFSLEPPMYITIIISYIVTYIIRYWLIVCFRFTWGPTGQVDLAEVMRFDRFFNWSMTYRNDADIHLFFGVIKPKDSIPFDIKDVLPAPFKISRDAIPAFN